MKPSTWHVLTVILLAISIDLAANESRLIVENYWIREMPPVATATAGYMAIKNTSGKLQRLVGVESPYFEKVEVHRTVEKDGVARMVKQERIEIAPGATLVMEPGGYHVMLIGFKRPLKEGDVVPLTLKFQGTLSEQISIPVRKNGRGNGHTHGHHH